jgi:hypothetical protein
MNFQNAQRSLLKREKRPTVGKGHKNGKKLQICVNTPISCYISLKCVENQNIT